MSDFNPMEAADALQDLTAMAVGIRQSLVDEGFSKEAAELVTVASLTGEAAKDWRAVLEWSDGLRDYFNRYLSGE